MAPINFSNLSPEDQYEFVDNIDTVCCDCDGVIWIGKHIIEGAADAINLFQSLGKEIFLITNNGRKTRLQLYDKLSRNGFNIQEEHVLCTAPIIAKYIDDQMDRSKSAYVIGSQAISSELTKLGINNFGIGLDPPVTGLYDGTHLSKIELQQNVGAVAVSYDEYYNFIKVTKAASYLKDPLCLFVATDRDERTPVKDQRYVIPGSGTILAAIECCTARKATVIGKPNTFIYEYMKQTFSIDPQRTIMIGDRYNSDILFGNLCNFTTILALTGTHNLNDIEQLELSNNEIDQKSIPKYYIESFADFLPALKNHG